jgi:hypothetical protein
LNALAETLRDIVWSEEGYLFGKKMFESPDTGKLEDYVFFAGKSIEDALEGNYEIVTKWRHKYLSERIYDTEEEAIKDILEEGYCEDDETEKLLEERLKDIKDDEE